MIINSDSVTLPHAAGRLLAQEPDQAAPGNGELGIPLLIPLIVGAGLVVGGGTLWTLNERTQERGDYRDCIDKYTAPPYSMPPQEAAMVCGGGVEQGFKFGLNAPTFLLTAASVFGMWFVTQLMITAAKAKFGGK